MLALTVESWNEGLRRCAVPPRSHREWVVNFFHLPMVRRLECGTLPKVSAQSRIHAVLEWLRAGYPGGVPGPDRVPLLALLRSTPLTDDEIKEVVREIAAAEAGAPAGHLVDYDEIERFVEGVAHHDGGPENVKRVAAQLAAAGWPLAGIDADGIWTEEAAVES